MSDVRLQIGGMGCAACAAQIEGALRLLPGVADVRVDAAAAEARVSVDTRAGALEGVLTEIRRLGFSALPAGSGLAAESRRLERRASLKRLAVAGFGMMQVMMLAFALYAAESFRMDPALREFLRWLSLIITVPVAVYAGGPIFRAAAGQLRASRIAMDVPVGIGLGAALLGSAWNTAAGAGPVYYDAVTMFLFFICTARFVEMTSRHHVCTVTEALARLLPSKALRIAGGRSEEVPAGELRPGDEVLVNPGEAAPADGLVASGMTAFDESCLTGESAPVTRRAGDVVRSGSINAGDGVRVRVTATGDATELAAVLRLLERSRTARPRLPALADHAARLFSLAVLAIAVLVGVTWLVVQPDVALANTVAVLVVACPCALSLAAPASIASANAALARLGLLPVSASAVEQLARVRHVVVDKTGTLTAGRPSVALESLRAAPAAEHALAIAAALERGSSHPLARGFRRHEDPAVQAVATIEHPGQGVAGRVSGRDYRIGRPAFVAGMGPARAPGPEEDGSALLLGDRDGIVARLHVTDPLRTGARDALGALRQLGLGTEIASGDAPEAVAAVAESLGIDHWQARMTPAEKVARLSDVQAAGLPVMLIGDGVNDAPAVARADLSVVMRSGSALAQTSGDLLMLDDAWTAIPRAVVVARRARAIMRQNLAWAAAYNLLAIPLAALGFLPPWLSALGMSASSILVVLNARRVAI